MEAIRYIHLAGGLAFMAHPGIFLEEADDIRELASYGFDGVEVYHPSHNAGKIEQLEAIGIRRKQTLQRKSIQRLALSNVKTDEQPDEKISRLETVVEVRSAMARLPAEQQQVVRMRIYEEKTFAAIAEEIGAPLGTVLTRMRLALQKLHREFDSKETGD